MIGKSESFFERHAWKALLVVILFIGFFGVSDMVGGASDLQSGETVYMHSITGMSWNDLQAASPKVANLIDEKFRSDGATLATIALLSIAVILTGFRRGERWASFALWALPFWMMSNTFFLLSRNKLPGSGRPVPVISGSILALICLASLGLSYRKFFRA